MTSVTETATPASRQILTKRTPTWMRALPFLVAIASPVILDNISWNPFGGWKLLVGFLVLVGIGWFAWSNAEHDPDDPRLSLKLWHRADQRALAAVTCFVLMATPFILSTDWEPPMDFPWNSWFRIVNYIILFALGAGAFNLLVGYTGQLSMAHAAFLMIGTMVGAQVGLIWEQSFWLCLPLHLLVRSWAYFSESRRSASAACTSCWRPSASTSSSSLSGRNTLFTSSDSPACGSRRPTFRLGCTGSQESTLKTESSSSTRSSAGSG